MLRELAEVQPLHPTVQLVHDPVEPKYVPCIVLELQDSQLVEQMGVHFPELV
jgi:hypothetical protein